jgi:hypothetical protein
VKNNLLKLIKQVEILHIIAVMGTYPKHREPFRKHAGYRICPYCKKSIKARGIGTHIRQVHKLLVKTVVNTQVNDLSATKVNDLSTKVINSSDNLSTKVITQELSEVTGKDLSECKRPEGDHLYTDQDLWILLGRINSVVLNDDSSNFLSRLNSQNICYELIRDFEQRFDCKFSDVKKVNPEIKPGKTNKENTNIALKYSHLKYSRPGGFLQENWTKI